jgi:DNA-binding XRE family transcriptional regulator
MTAQIIKQDDQPEWAVIPYKEYLELLEKVEMLEDVAAYDRAIAINEEGIPHEVVKSLVEGENPLKVWRTYRGLTQIQLAEKTGLSQSQIAMIESGEREGTVKVLRRIAKALNVDIDDLVDIHENEPSSG